MHDWDRIAEQYGSLVWKAAWRVLRDHNEAADCCQDVFVEAIQRANDQAIDHWAAFLSWLTVRRAIDRLRTRRRQVARREADRSVDEIPAQLVSGSDAEWEELIEVVRQELALLPEQQAQVFWLHCIEEVSMRDVAEQLSISANHARVLLHRARGRLQELLQDHRMSSIGRQL